MFARIWRYGDIWRYWRELNFVVENLCFGC